jgi:undecaprenyl-diphosphatase
MLKNILELDLRWSNILRVAERPGTLRTVAMIFAHSGDSWFWGAGLVVLWLPGNPFWKQWAVYELFWISFLAAFVMALKFSIRRRRPAGEWGAIYRNTDPHSFPSGHAARAFLIMFIAAVLGPFWLAMILVVWAPLVSLARVAMGVHYLSDVIAGAIVGLIVAAIAMEFSPALFSFLSHATGVAFW